jgi:hypothetical protein
LDQAEELFNADAGPEAHHFLEILAALIEHEAGVTPALIVALTIRADRYEPLQIAPELAELRSAVFDDLKPMPPAGFKEVITGPAQRATAAGRRLTVEPTLVERLLAETAEGADALPLLALTLHRLCRDFGADGDLTLAEYEAMGGMAQMVQTEVDKLLAADPEAWQTQLDTLHDAFIPWLATVNPASNQPMRRLARWDDLPPASRPLIQAMVEKRLLVKDTRDGQTLVEVALESLLRQWRELAAWLGEESQDLKDADSLERAAADWRTSGQNESWLLPGTRLAEAEALAEKPRFRERLDPTLDFLHASRRGEDDRTDARRQADTRLRKANGLRLVSEAQLMLAGTRSGGQVLAFQQLLVARRLAETPDDGPLLDALAKTITTIKIIETTSGVAGLAFSPDGHRIVSGGDDMTVRVWDADTGQPIGDPLTGHTVWVTSVAFSPDGQRIVSGSADSTLRLWPNYPDPVSAMCAKLTTNMSHQQWRDWVSPSIDYIEACPGLPIQPDAPAH